MLENLIENAIRSCGNETELRAQRNTNHKVSFLSGNLISNTRKTAGGVSARVFKNGYWGHSASSQYDIEGVKAVLKAADENAEFLSGHLEKKDSRLEKYNPINIPLSREYVDIPQKMYIDFGKKLDEYIEKNCPSLTGRTVVVTADTMEKLLCTTGGTVAHTIAPRVYVYIFMSAQAADGSNIELFDAVHGGEGYFTDYFTDFDKCFEAADKLYKKVLDKCNGVFPEAGVADVILDADLAGMLAHEAVGHTVEADLVMGGSVAGPNLGKQVASEMVNLVDFANTALGKPCPLPMFVDEEGVPATDEWIIRDGVLVGFMNNRESAAKFDMQPHGNARAHTFADEPIIRMRNTAILPGTDKLSDMIASIDHGYYLTDTGNGQADTTGEFMFGINMGYEIVNGKLGKPLRDTTISGVAFDMLKTVTMLSDEISWQSSGYCGKKQLIPVGCGGPAVKCKVNIGGR